MKKALVTGGCGFIGSHLVEALLNGGYQVVVLDNLVTGSKANLAHLQTNKHLQIVEADVRDSEAIAPHFIGIDVVFHLAALADMVPSIEAPEDYYSTNVTGTFNVLQAAVKAKVKKLVYAASSSCYGVPDTFPTNESAEIRLEFPYALTKYLGEELVKHWCHVYKLPTVSLRLFNVYGLRSRSEGAYGSVFGIFMAEKRAGKPLTVVGDGEQGRDFVYVKDVVRAMMMAAESDVAGEVMNVGTGDVCTVNQLAALLGGERQSITERPGEVDFSQADISKIQKLLAWKPTYTLEQGVKEVLGSISTRHPGERQS